MITDTLHYWQSEFTQLRDNYEAELKVLPEGKLSCYHDNKGYTHYYQTTTDVDDERLRKGIGRNPNLLRQLARKAYLGKAIKLLNANIASLSCLQKRWKPCSPQEIIAHLPNSLRDVPADAFLCRHKDLKLCRHATSAEERIRSHITWGQQRYPQSERHLEQLTITTSFGLQMRSKAESLIAEKLHEYGIPFRYEQTIKVGIYTFAPDFTFEGADGSEFYLEFCGMMDDPTYVQNFLWKRQQYELADIVPWRNMIYIYATGNNLDMQEIDSIIQTRVIGWL